MNKTIVFTSLLFMTCGLYAQTQTGVFKTSAGNTDYHHFTRNGNGAAVYINQESLDTSKDILKLSSGTATANQGVKLRVKHDGTLGVGFNDPSAKLHVWEQSSDVNKHLAKFSSGGSITDESVKFLIKNNGDVSIGTTSTSARLNVVRNGIAGETGKNAVTITNATITTENTVSYDKGLYSSMSAYNIPAGIRDNGYKIGIDASAYSSKEYFSGILYRNMGVWARAGIHKSGDGARIEHAIAVEAEILDNGTNATISNAYGVRISTNGYKKATVLNRYDLYASTESAKNYFAGNVGIGTKSPGTWKLAVNGNIRAKEIKVETGWSDFVFYDDYELPTLKEVEEHINTYGHLKDIPSAAEVEKNGIKLGEINSRLLQKIEELTLYTIEQEKKIEQLESLQKSSEKQAEEIKELKQLVKQLLESK